MHSGLSTFDFQQGRDVARWPGPPLNDWRLPDRLARSPRQRRAPGARLTPDEFRHDALGRE
jgi:hypothetical protein